MTTVKKSLGTGIGRGKTTTNSCSYTNNLCIFLPDRNYYASSLEWTKSPDLQVFRNTGDLNCWREEVIYHRTQAVHTGGVSWFINAIALLQEKAHLFKYCKSCFVKYNRVLLNWNHCQNQCITCVIKILP